MTVSRLALFLIASSLTQGCGGPKNAAMPAANPRGPERCFAPEEAGSVWFADAGRQDIEDLAAVMRRGIAVLAHDCNGLRLLPNCKVSGSYGYIGMSRREQVIQFVSRDELNANLPLSGQQLGSKFEGERNRSGALDLASVIVGKLSSPRRFVKSQDLLGDCQGATHIVADADVGASALLPGKQRQKRTLTEIFEATAAELLKAPHDTVGHAIGNLEACKDATPQARNAPGGCAAPIRLLLTRIGATPALAESAVPLAACGGALVMNLGKCTHRGAGVATQCDPRDSKACAEQCNLGSAGSCLTLGAFYEKVNGGRTDTAKAAAMYRRACDGNEMAGCLRLGVMTELGKGVARDPKSASNLYERACFGANVEGCLKLGVMLETAMGVPEDVARAVPLYALACDHRLQPGCDRLAQVYGRAREQSEALRRAKQAYLDGCYGTEPAACASLSVLAAATESQRDESPRILHVTPDDRKRLYELACGDDAASSCLPRLAISEKSCADHSGWDCLTLAFAYYGLADYEHNHLPQDLDRAALMFERACHYGETIACNNLGLMISAGEGFPRDVKSAAELEEQGCNAGSSEACANFGFMLERGRGVPKDVARAFDLYQQACSLRGGGACNHLGWHYLLGAGVTKDPKRGLALFKSGCDLQFDTSHDACDSLAFAQLNGIGMKSNERQALRAFEKACESGLEEACMNAGFMYLFGRGTAQNEPKAEVLFKAGCNEDRVAEWEQDCTSKPRGQRSCRLDLAHGSLRQGGSRASREVARQGMP